MGMYTGVASAADVQRNAASGRTHFSGECLRRAKAVSDAAAGGQVLLPEASREALDADAVRAARHCLLYMGQHRLAKLVGGGVGQQGGRGRLHGPERGVGLYDGLGLVYMDGGGYRGTANDRCTGMPYSMS